MEQIDWIGNCEKIVPTIEAQTCPCCDQMVKIYRRKVSGVAARDLIKFSRTSADGEYRHISKIQLASGGGDFAKLQLWGLVEEELNFDTGKRTSGMWCITKKGRDFVAGNVHVPKYILIYNGKFLGFDGDQVTIEECLGNNFNYSELMSA